MSIIAQQLTPQQWVSVDPGADPYGNTSHGGSASSAGMAGPHDMRIGECSKCGGDVVRVTVWWGVGPPPRARCLGCGAVEKLPVIEMQ